MASVEDHWSSLIQGLRDGNRQIVQRFCDEYGALLHQLADKHLAGPVRRRVGPEDVVQSACRTFLRRARAGEFQLADSEALWRLLCAITLTKVREQVRFHQRRKRGVDQEVQLEVETLSSSAGPCELVDPGPSPAEMAEFADQFHQLMASLDAEERQLVDLKLQQYTNEEVAERMGCSERTVRRLLKRVQRLLERAFPVS